MTLNLDTGDRTWGHLARTEHYGRVTDPSDYILLTKDELKSEPYCSTAQASHCMVYAKNNVKTFGVYNPRAAVLVSGYYTKFQFVNCNVIPTVFIQ